MVNVDKLRHPDINELKHLAISFDLTLIQVINPVYSRYLQTGTLTNSEDSDEMPHNAAFHQGLYVCKDNNKPWFKHILFLYFELTLKSYIHTYKNL